MRNSNLEKNKKMEDEINTFEHEPEVECLNIYRRGNALFLKTSDDFREMNMSEQISVINGTVEVLLRNFDSGAIATVNVDDDEVSVRMHNTFEMLSLGGQQKYFNEAAILFRKMSEALGQQKLLTTETVQ